jgi:hypothetical protein
MAGDELFIGWLPMPQGYVRFLRLVAIGGIVLAITIATVIAAFQRDPGAARWDADNETTFTGIVFARPYAMLYVPGDEPRTMLLVESGKLGALPRVQALLGDRAALPVRATGTVLQRDGRWMLELAEGEEGLRLLQDAGALSSLPASEPQLLAGNVTLTGEIIDPKCYLGAMKPGGGKTHKACAALCISGGIPPMLVTRNDAKGETFYLLTTAGGGPANDLILPFVGDQVTVSGRLEKVADLQILTLKPGGVRRR